MNFEEYKALWLSELVRTILSDGESDSREERWEKDGVLELRRVKEE